MKEETKNTAPGITSNIVSDISLDGASGTALLVMDVQPGIVGRLEHKDEYVAKVKIAIDAAHAGHVPVIFVVVGFREGFPDVNARNKSFGAILQNMPAGMVNPRPSIELAPEDVLVTKRRVCAFTGSDLEVVLRSKHIQHLVLAGISTSGVVLSTVREAADKDYQLTVLRDLCADFDPEVHAVLLEKVFPRQTDVVTSEEWMNSLKAQASLI